MSESVSARLIASAAAIQLNSGTVAAPGVIPWPATIAASGTFGPVVVATGGNPHIAIGGTLSNAGTLTIQPCLDVLGNINNGAAITAALVAATAFISDTKLTVVAQSLKISIVNGAASVANLTNPIAVVANS
jgi:hypothetical protein